MAHDLIVYSTIGSPTLIHSDVAGEFYYEVEAVCSFDGGETCRSGYFNLDTEENAEAFAKQVNSSFPPLTIGEDDE